MFNLSCFYCTSKRDGCLLESTACFLLSTSVEWHLLHLKTGCQSSAVLFQIRWLLCTHWCASSIFFSLHDLAPVPRSIVWNVCLSGWSREGSSSERFTVKFSHQRTDGCEETAGVMQAHTRTYTHTHRGPWGSHALCQVGQTHSLRMRTHIHVSTNRPLRLTYIEPGLV